jgi:hypothetical protein
LFKNDLNWEKTRNTGSIKHESERRKDTKDTHSVKISNLHNYSD